MWIRYERQKKDMKGLWQCSLHFVTTGFSYPCGERNPVYSFDGELCSEAEG
jgi:hypothetical protein